MTLDQCQDAMAALFKYARRRENSDGGSVTTERVELGYVWNRAF